MNKRLLGAVLVPVTIDGITVRVDPNSIDKKERKILHGEYKGTQVNSPAVVAMGESLIFWPEADKKLAISMDKASAGVFATELLESDGFAITPKSAT